MRKSKNWIFEVCDENHKLINIGYIQETKFDKKNIETLAERFADQGITQKQMEDAILKEAKECNIKPPKYLR